MRVIHENSERDIAVAAFGRELRAFSAQLLRIIAGAGNAYDLMNTWRDLIRVIDDWPKGEFLPTHYELSRLLDPEFGHEGADARFYDSVTKGSLRLVASKYQGLPTQERAAESQIMAAVRHLEIEREAERRARQERARANPHSVDVELRQALQEIEIGLLSPSMVSALAYIGTMGAQERRTASRPVKNTLQALVRRKMLARDPDGVLGYRLTRHGRRALKNRAAKSEHSGWGE